MEKVIFSDYVKMEPTDNALKVLSDLQRRFPASALVNLFYLKLQPTCVQSRHRARLLLTLPDRRRLRGELQAREARAFLPRAAAPFQTRRDHARALSRLIPHPEQTENEHVLNELNDGICKNVAFLFEEKF